MASGKERAVKAIETMKRMGFQRSRIVPVLKELIKACENSWEHIQADNYSLLIEAIFEAESLEDRDKARKTRGAVAEEPESYRKRRRQSQLQEESNRSSLLAITASISLPKTLKSGTDDFASTNTPELDYCSTSYHVESEKYNIGRNHMSASTSQQQENLEHSTPFPDCQRKIVPEVECPTESQRLSPKEHSITRRSPEKLKDTEYLKEPKIEPGLSIGNGEIAPPDKIEPIVCDPICIEFPVLMLRPPLEAPTIEEAQSLEDLSQMSYQSQNTDEDTDECSLIYTRKKRKTCGMIVDLEESSKNIEIASSTVGEQRISLSYNVSEAPDFHMPSIESVLKRVENRCLQLHPNLGGSFSLMDVMKDVCNSILELGTGKATDDQEGSIKMTTVQDSQKASDINKSLSVASAHSFDNHCSSAINEDYTRNEDYSRKGKAIDRSPEPSSELALVSLHELPCDSDEPSHDVCDISKGEERVKIPIVNEFPGERCPPHFTYIPHNIAYQKAHLNFSLAQLGDDNCCSDCFGDCLVASLPCACAGETGGEFAYTSGGLLKNEFLDECIAMRHYPSESCMVYCKDCPLQRGKYDVYPEKCKGHLLRKFIKECWRKCGCHKLCGNRVVQQGIWCNLQVFWTPSGKGWGLRSTYDLPRGAFVCEYIGEVLTRTELYERTAKMSSNARHTYPIILDADWGSEAVLKDEDALCLDGTFYGNVARFINHQCFDANLVEVPVVIETPDHYFYHVALFTTRKVDAFEELTWDYGIDFDKDDHLIKAFQCQCDSIKCRDKSRSTGKRPAGIRIS